MCALRALTYVHMDIGAAECEFVYVRVYVCMYVRVYAHSRTAQVSLMYEPLSRKEGVCVRMSMYESCF